MLRKIIFFIVIAISLSVSCNSYAGIISKSVKGIAAVKAAKIVSKKIIQNKTKDSTKPLLNKELSVGKYKKQRQAPEDNLDYHHMPSAKMLEKNGIHKNDGISIGVQHDRHSLTRTYKSGNKPILKNNETMRDALARDVKDLRKIYKDNNLYDKKVRNALQEAIKKNKESFPQKYEKTK